MPIRHVCIETNATRIGKTCDKEKFHEERTSEIGVEMLPSVTRAKHVIDYLIEVRFNDGTKK
jgi:hypothetical protein